VDSEGDKLWDRTFGGQNGEPELGNISQTADGGYLLAGSSYSGIGGDKSEEKMGRKQIWVIKTDSVGNKIWDKTILSPGDDSGYAIQSADGSYVVAG
jgi:hypothetical protein